MVDDDGRAWFTHNATARGEYTTPAWCQPGEWSISFKISIVSAKFNLHTTKGINSFTDFVEGVVNQDLRRILEVNPKATGKDVADHFVSVAESHHNGASGYWGLADGDFTVLTNDPAAERTVFIKVGDQLIKERR